MTTIVGSLVDKALDGLANLHKGGDSAGQHGGQSTINGPDAPIPGQRPGGSPEHHDGGWQHGTDGIHQGPPTGGPSLPGGPGMQTGGPAPQGMQDVFPNIAQQLASSLSSVVDGLGSLTRSTVTANAAPVPPTATQAAANAFAQPGPATANTQAAAQQAVLGATAPNAIATAAPTTAAAATSQAASANAVANPASPTLAQPAAPLPRTIGDANALAQNRPAETAMPPRPENASLLARMAAALQPGAMPPSATATTVPTLPTPPPGVTQAMTAAGLTMATASVNTVGDARGAIFGTTNDMAVQRADNTLTLAGHTLDGLQRRSMRNRVQLLPQRLTRLLWAMGLMGTQANEREADSERELQRVMQWLFWMLAVIAYGCLAVAIVALVGSNSRMFDYEAGRSYTGWLAFFGLVTGTVAWLIARRISHRR